MFRLLCATALVVGLGAVCTASAAVTFTENNTLPKMTAHRYAAPATATRNHQTWINRGRSGPLRSAARSLLSWTFTETEHRPRPRGLDLRR